MNCKYESETLQVIHEDIKEMHKAGIISDERMREFDNMCLLKKPEPGKREKKMPILEHTTV
jgi:DNA-binding transcriptional regulator YiaG